MIEAFAIIGFLAVSAALLTLYCDPMLEGLARRCTARRIARRDYWDSYRRQMNQDSAQRVIEAVER